MSALAGRHILVTRPAGQADGLLQAIRDHGGDAVHTPVMAIEPLHEENGDDQQCIRQCKQQILELDGFYAVIFISGNAVAYGLRWIDQYWPQLPIDVLWFGIGRSTVEKLKTEGIPALDTKEHGPMDSEALLEHPELQQLLHKKILIIRGVGGREFLADQLQARGAEVRYLECYRRTIANNSTKSLSQLILERNIDTVCINSGQSLGNFLQMLGPEGKVLLSNILVVVPGERVARLAGEAGIARIAQAKNASDDAVLDAIKAAT